MHIIILTFMTYYEYSSSQFTLYFFEKKKKVSFKNSSQFILEKTFKKFVHKIKIF